MATVTWDVSAADWVSHDGPEVARRVLARVRPGSIIILHVWYLSRATSVAAVGPLIDSLHARGYRVGPVRELLLPRHFERRAE
jgi:peptidoglycan/xylan/chitin deacetylase (PgdA/CDA1 family)